ncbi:MULTISPECIES: hypothetical protein [unclassified Streptomyces]|uniref:hypothetical protein n=1 Tax=unclassified Streptomyces TaxID=2593676 RepID=UPI0036B1194C
MSKTTATRRTALRAAVTSALIVLVTGAGLQTSWADGTAPATTTPSTSATPTPGATGGTGTTDGNNPWD